MSRPVALLSLDGLSQQQFDQILNLSATLRENFLTQNRVTLDSSPFVESHPIWAELLTGVPWYENGCVAYARPVGSLDKLEVMTEDQLISPIKLIGNGPASISSNVPLVCPRERTWIADGSAPSMILAKPESLRKQLGAKYRARSQSMLALSLREPLKAAEAAAVSDLDRLRALSSVTETNNWHEAIVRLTYFDQIQHIYGLQEWLHPKHLSFPITERIIKALETFTQTLLKRCGQISILSAYSLTRCSSRFNLNALLKEAGFLHAQPPASTSDSSQRVRAAEAIGNATLSGATLSSLAGRLMAEKTLAASPVSGAIYLNLRSNFEDGSIVESDKASILADLQELLEAGAVRYFGGRAIIHAAPPTATTKSLPQFFAQIAGTEFFDTGETVLDTANKPAVCHSGTGFLCSPNASSSGKQMTLLQTHHALIR